MEIAKIDYMGFQEVLPCGSGEEDPTSKGLKSFSWSSVEAASQQGKSLRI